MHITKKAFFLLTAGVLLTFTIYLVQERATNASFNNAGTAEPKWKHRVLRERIQNNQIGFDSMQTDSYRQRIREYHASGFIDRLHQMLAKDRAAEQQRQQWQRAVKEHNFHPLDSNERYLLYSAHYDALQNLIKLIGFGPMHDDHTYIQSLRCKTEDNTSNTEKGKFYIYYRISTFYPWKGQIYDSYIYACNMSLGAPASVTITSSTDDNIHVKLPLTYENITPNYKFAVCVEPLVKGYSDVEAIRHYIAVNTMFGAEHFYFYVCDASSEVTKLLDSMSMVTVYPWHLNSITTRTHAFGQKASNAHCLYNHRSRASYLIYIDIDEVLVPRSNGNWSEMMNRIINDRPTQGAVVFQSKLFPMNTPSDSPADDVAVTNKLRSLTQTKSVGVFNPYQWSKVLVDTSRTDIVDIHKIREMLPGYTVVNADPSVALIHHYREYKYSNGSLIDDGYMTMFRERLLKVYEQLFG